MPGHSDPTRSALIQRSQNDNHRPDIVSQAPISPNGPRKQIANDPKLLETTSSSPSDSAKPLDPQARPSNETLEQPNLGLGKSCLDDNPLANEFIMGKKFEDSDIPVAFRAMTGAVFSQECIRDNVMLALRNAESLCPNYLDQDLLFRLIPRSKDLELEFLDILKFGDPRDYLTPINNEQDLEGEGDCPGTINHVKGFRGIFDNFRHYGSYATFPVSNNLIVFAKLPKRQNPVVCLEQLQIAELLLERTEDDADISTPQSLFFIGHYVVKSFVNKLECTRKIIGWTGWYSAKEDNRKANWERATAEEEALECNLRKSEENRKYLKGLGEFLGEHLYNIVEGG